MGIHARRVQNIYYRHTYIYLEEYNNISIYPLNAIGARLMILENKKEIFTI